MRSRGIRGQQAAYRPEQLPFAERLQEAAHPELPENFEARAPETGEEQDRNRRTERSELQRESNAILPGHLNICNKQVNHRAVSLPNLERRPVGILRDHNRAVAGQEPRRERANRLVVNHQENRPRSQRWRPHHSERSKVRTEIH